MKQHLPSILAFIFAAFYASLAIVALVLIYISLNEALLTRAILKENLIGGGSFFMFLSLLFLVGRLTGRVPNYSNKRVVEKNSYPPRDPTRYSAEYYLFAILFGSLFIIAIGFTL